MKAFEYSGIWWLPAKAENTVSGTLTFSNENGIELNLIGALAADFGSFSTLKSYPLILGLSAEGKEITLTNCATTGLSVSVPGLPRERYKASFCLVGSHFKDSAELRFSRLSVRYSHLPDWVRTTGFEVRKYFGEHKVEITYSLPSDVEAETSMGSVSVSFTCNTAGDGIEEMNLRQSVWMEAKAEREYGIRDLIVRYIRPLQNFLSLATTKPNTILELDVYSKKVVVEVQDESRVERPIKLFFKQKHFESRHDGLLIPDFMLFTLHDIPDDLKNVLERWFWVSNELDSVCDLFFSAQQTPSIYGETKFLNMVQAVESYHRRRMNNYVLPKTEYKALKTGILDKVDNEIKDWLRDALTYSNEPRLERRIHELIDKVYDVISPLIGNREDFARKVKDTRNYLTHYDNRLKSKSAKGADLFRLTQTLSYLLQACFLTELGLTLEKSAELMHRNQQFIFAQGQAERIRALATGI